MLKVKDIMTKELITILDTVDIAEAAKILLGNHINGVPVVEKSGKLVGILCQSDLIAQQKQFPIPSLFTFLDGIIATSSLKSLEKEVNKIAATTVKEAMTPNPKTVTSDTDITTVATLMVDNNYHTIPVVDNEKLVGILGKEDILKTLIP